MPELATSRQEFSLCFSPLALSKLGLGGSYVLWLGILAVGTVFYALFGRNSPYFQFLKQGLPPADARVRARECGQDLMPAGSLVDSLAYLPRGFGERGRWFGSISRPSVVSSRSRPGCLSYWINFFGVSIVKAGMLTAAFAILASLIRVVGGVLSDQLQEGGENTAILALLIALVGALVMTSSHQFELSVPGEILLAVGMGLCNAAVFKIVPQAVPQAVGGAAGWVGGLGAFGGFVLPPVMAFAVHNLGTTGYAIGFVTFVFLTLFSLSMAWILKYTREIAVVHQTQQSQSHPLQKASAPEGVEHRR